MSALRPRVPLGVGCELLGGTDWGHVDEDQATSAIRSALESGVEVFDTADAYGLGRSETRLSGALGDARHQATIISKFGVRWEDAAGRARTWRDNSPAYLVEALEASLRRLDVERVPYYLVHWPDGVTSVDDVLAALADQRQRGKIGGYGLSNFDTGELLASADAGADLVELPVSLLEPARIGDLAAAVERGLSTVAYGVYAQGLLTGKYDSADQFGADDRRHRLPQFARERWEANRHLLTRLRMAADLLDARPNEVALAWVLEQHVDVALFGARTPAHVASALRGAELVITPEARAVLLGGEDVA